MGRWKIKKNTIDKFLGLWIALSKHLLLGGGQKTVLLLRLLVLKWCSTIGADIANQVLSCIT